MVALHAHVDASPPLFAELLRRQLASAGIEADADDDCEICIVTPDRRSAVAGRVVISLEDGVVAAVTVERQGCSPETRAIPAADLPSALVDLTRGAARR